MVTVQATRILRGPTSTKAECSGVGDGYADLSGRSVNAVYWRNLRGTAPGVGRSANHHGNTGTAYLIPGRFALASGHGRRSGAAGVARWIANHLSPRPGPARVRLKLEFNWDMVPAYNVIARLAGSEYPDEWVIRGNHHDG